jgi:hypothetical protein
MTAPRTSIDRGVAALFRAIAANAKGDRLMVAAARGELVALAGETEDFEAKLANAVVNRLAPALSNASRDEVERAVSIDIRRHVGNSLRLADAEPWGAHEAFDFVLRVSTVAPQHADRLCDDQDCRTRAGNPRLGDPSERPRAMAGDGLHLFSNS